MKCCPIDNIENQEYDWKCYEHCHVHLAGFVLLHRGGQFSERFDLHLEQDDCVFKKSTEHEKDAAYYPGLHGVQSICLG